MMRQAIALVLVGTITAMTTQELFAQAPIQDTSATASPYPIFIVQIDFDQERPFGVAAGQIPSYENVNSATPFSYFLQFYPFKDDEFDAFRLRVHRWRSPPNPNALSFPTEYRFRKWRSADRQTNVDAYVVPISGELYYISLLWTAVAGETDLIPSISLEQVTAAIPERFRTQDNTRCIPLAMPSAAAEHTAGLDHNVALGRQELFWNESLNQAGCVVVEAITGDAAESGAVAHVLVEPPPNRLGPAVVGANPAGNGQFFTVRRWYGLTLQRGELLASEFQAYRVLNIVEPQDVELEDGRTVHLIGWIELDPEPLPPPSDPAVAPDGE